MMTHGEMLYRMTRFELRERERAAEQRRLARTVVARKAREPRR